MIFHLQPLSSLLFYGFFFKEFFFSVEMKAFSPKLSVLKSLFSHKIFSYYNKKQIFNCFVVKFWFYFSYWKSNISNFARGGTQQGPPFWTGGSGILVRGHPTLSPVFSIFYHPILFWFIFRFFFFFSQTHSVFFFLFIMVYNPAKIFPPKFFLFAFLDFFRLFLENIYRLVFLFEFFIFFFMSFKSKTI